MKPVMVGMEPVWRVGTITIPTITECVNSQMFIHTFYSYTLQGLIPCSDVF